MHAKPAGTTNTTTLAYVQDLAAALTARGLAAKGYADDKHAFVWARNPADSRLTQVVVLKPENGELSWFWQWTGRETTRDLELEYMAPATAIAQATERISRVLSLAAT